MTYSTEKFSKQPIRNFPTISIGKEIVDIPPGNIAQAILKERLVRTCHAVRLTSRQIEARRAEYATEKQDKQLRRALRRLA